MVRKIKKIVEIRDIEKFDEEMKVSLSLQMFEIYFPTTSAIISKEKFNTLMELKEWLMTLDEDLIRKETSKLLDEFRELNGLEGILSDESLTLSTPQGRYNCYKYASNYIAITMLGNNVRN